MLSVSDAKATGRARRSDRRAQQRQHGQRVAQREGQRDGGRDRQRVAPSERRRQDEAEHLARGTAGQAVKGGRQGHAVEVLAAIVLLVRVTGHRAPG